MKEMVQSIGEEDAHFRVRRNSYRGDLESTPWKQSKLSSVTLFLEK